MPPADATSDTSPTGHALHEAKRALRAQVIAARDALDPAYRTAAAHEITSRLAALGSFNAARVVLVTLPFGSEWDSRPLAQAALAAGKTLAMPRVNNATRMLELHTITDLGADVVAGYRGIPEPLPSLPHVDNAEIDWVLVPGVAFNADGFRLGYGGGYYDRLMTTLAPAVSRIAGAFDAQIAPRIPAAAHDLRVDLVVTESRTLSGPVRG